MSEYNTLLLGGLSSPSNDKDAIVFNNRRISYREFNEYASRTMYAMRQKGVTAGDRIAIWLKKTPETVILILATMGLGAAYVPIDPSSPETRVRTLLRDCEPRLLFIGDEQNGFSIGAYSAASTTETIVLSRSSSGYELAAFLAGSRRAEASRIQADDLAAILYTSGSTGDPKGVMLSHGNISNFVGWAVQTFSLDASDRVTSHAPFHFDLSTFDLFATLQVGGTVYLLSEVSVKFPGAIAKLLENERITVWYSVPTALKLLASRGGIADRDLTDLRLIFFAGEVFQPHALREVMDALPHADFYNLYGPTETNVCTYYKVPRPLPHDCEAIPVGIPCPPLDVQIRDELGRAVPAGETGEICVGGPGVMLGYWNDERKTARTRLGMRIDSYRTGDFGYVRPDGNIIFAGRRDNQVKLRGHRIELLEIEAVACSHPQVDDAAALLITTVEGSQTLRVFAVPTGTTGQPDSIALKKHCATKLPPYCTPDEIIWIDDLPRTSTGKIDRRSLVEDVRPGIR